MSYKNVFFFLASNFVVPNLYAFGIWQPLFCQTQSQKIKCSPRPRQRRLSSSQQLRKFWIIKNVICTGSPNKFWWETFRDFSEIRPKDCKQALTHFFAIFWHFEIFAKFPFNFKTCWDRYLAPPFLVEDYVPLAVRAHRKGDLKHRVEAAQEELRSCKACPRNCGVDRLQNKMGACNTGRKAIVSSAFPHFGEESVLQGWNGSGTIFFGMCNLRCVFCQNWDISQKKNGWELSAKEIADLMLKLQNESKLVW